MQIMAEYAKMGEKGDRKREKKVFGVVHLHAMFGVKLGLISQVLHFAFMVASSLTR